MGEFMAAAYHVSHNGTSYGPKSMDEVLDMISDRTIDASALVWHEGMTEWAAIRTLREFDTKFKSIPPPIRVGGSTPPPLPDEIQRPSSSPTKKTSTSSARAPKRKKKAAMFGGGALMLIGVAIGGTFLYEYILANQSTTPTYKPYVPPPPPAKPMPVTVEQSGQGENQGFEYVAIVKGIVRNKGASGFVTIIGQVFQGNKTIQRTKRVYLDKDEQTQVRFELDEVDSGEWKYVVKGVAE